jgi:hypothetical protein
LGGSGGSAAVYLAGSSGTAIVIGSTTAANTVDIGSTGTAAYTDTVNINTSTGSAQTILAGSTNSGSTVTITGGNIAQETANNELSVTGSSTTAFVLQKSGGSGILLTGDTTDGYLGIGTSAPAALLDVNGASTFRGNVTIGTNTIIGSGTGDELTMNGASGYTILNGNSGWGVNVDADYLRLIGGGVGDVQLQFLTDTNISRGAAGTLDIGDGTYQDQSGTLLAGTIGLGKSSSANGLLEFNNSSNSNVISITTGAAGSTYGLTLPTTAPSTSQCLESGSGTPGLLVFTTCSGGGSVTLQQAYGYSAGASPSIVTTSTGEGVTIQNAYSSGVSGEVFGVHAPVSSGLGAQIFTVNSNGNVGVVTGTPGALFSVGGATGALQIDNSGDISTTGTYNTNTFTSTGLAFGSSTDSISSDGASSLTVDTGGSSTLNLGTTNASTVQVGTITASSGTQTIAIGNNAAGGTTNVTIGNNTAGSTLVQGTSSVNITPATGATITIGASAQTGTITLGSSSATNLISIGSGTLASSQTQTITIGSGGSTGTGDVVSIGNLNNAGSTTTLQGGTGTTAVTIQAGTGGTVLLGSSSANNVISIGSGTTTGAIGIALTTGYTGTITIDAGTGTSTVAIASGAFTGTQTVNIATAGASGGTENITIGSNTPTSGEIQILGPAVSSGQSILLTGGGNSNVTISSGGTGTLLVEAGAGGGTLSLGGNVNAPINIGNSVTSKAITIGGAETSGNIIIGNNTASSNGTIKLGLSLDTNIIDIGDGAIASSDTQTILIGNGAAASAGLDTVTIGDLNSTSQTIIQGGVLTTSTGVGGVLIGNGPAGSTTLIPLYLSADSTFSDTSSTWCSSSVNNGAMYYNSNTSSVSMRACIDGSWRDVLTNDDLGIMLYGVLPDSGPTGQQGDLESVVSANASGPCKVSWLTSTSVTVNACTLYTGARKVVYAGGSIGSLNSASVWYHICFTNGSSPTASTGGTEVANMPTWSESAPILCLADVETGGSSTITNIYDTRVFSTSTKTFAVYDTAGGTGLGWVVRQSSTAGLIGPTTTATDGPILGVVGLYSGSLSATTPNVIMVTAGPVYVKVTSGTAADTIEPTTTSGYGVATTATPSTTSYGNLGPAMTTTSSTCTAASNCQYSEFTDIDIK